MDYDDLMKISAENLRQLVPKMGPANKILDARAELRAENGSKRGGSNGNFYISDDEDEVVAQSEVIFVKIMLVKYLKYVLP